MRYNLLTPEGLEVGFITDEPEFRYELAEETPHFNEIKQAIEQSAEYDMVVAGATEEGEAAEYAVTPPEENVPANAHHRLMTLVNRLPRKAPVQVRLAEDTEKWSMAEDLTTAVDKTIGKADADDAAEMADDIDVPSTCRACGDTPRMRGEFLCPACATEHWDDFDAEDADFTLVKEWEYISDADTLSEAQQMAPADADVEEGPQGGFRYEDGSDAAEGADDDASGDDGSALASDERRVPLNDVELTEGTSLLFGEKGDEVKLEVTEVVNDPAQIYGQNAGYLRLEDGTYATLNGDRSENFDGEVFPDESVPDDQIRSLTNADGVDRGLPDPTGSPDPSEWAVEWDDVVYSNYDDDNRDERDRDLRRLSEREKEKFAQEWKAAAPEEGVKEVSRILTGIKGTTYTTTGQKYDKLVKAAFDVAGEPREGDFDDAESPSAEAVEAMEVFAAASREFMRQNYGEDFHLHRGLGNHAVERLSEVIEANYTSGDVDDDEQVTLRDNPAAVFTTDKKLSYSYEKGLTLHADSEVDDVLATPEALIDFSDGRGPDWNEGEVNVPGWDMDVEMSDLEVGESGWTVDEVLTDPMAAHYEATGSPVLKVATVFASNDRADAAHKLHRAFVGHTAYDHDDEDMRRIATKLSSAAEGAIKAMVKDDDPTPIIDLRPEAGWLAEVSETEGEADE